MKEFFKLLIISLLGASLFCQCSLFETKSLVGSYQNDYFDEITLEIETSGYYILRKGNKILNEGTYDFRGKTVYLDSWVATRELGICKSSSCMLGFSYDGRCSLTLFEDNPKYNFSRIETK